MKQKLLITILLFITVVNIFSQVNLDPNHKIYEDIYIWENKGLLINLPTQRPWPLHYINDVLNIVIVNGDKLDKEIAEAYLKETVNYIKGLEKNTFYANSIQNGFLSSLWLISQGQILDNLSIALRGGSYFTPDEKNISALPLLERRGADYNTDTSNVGPLELMSTWDSTVAFHTKNMWFQAGLSRTSFGPFYNDNVFFSPDAPQTGYFSFTFMKGNVVFNKSIHQLVATNMMGQGQRPDKFYSMNGIKWQMFPWLNLGIYDAVVFGNRFDILYLVPVTQHMYSQGVNGFIDNSLIGVTGEVKFPKNINLKGIFFVDDFDFNNTIKLNFDTKYKFALEARLNWAPENNPLRLLELGYTMMTPHMYSHGTDLKKNSQGVLIYNFKDPNLFNYDNFTTRGESLGTSLLPNSDKISLTSNLRLPFRLDLKVFTSYIRNGNAADNLVGTRKLISNGDGTYYLDVNSDGKHGKYTLNGTEYDEPLFLGDGSIHDHGMLVVDDYGEEQNHWEYSWMSSFPFLKQANINTTFNIGFDLTRSWDLKYLELTTGIKYQYQNYNGISNNYSQIMIDLKF